MAVKHAFNNAKTDGADATITRPSDWNADHTVDDASFTIAKTTGLQAALDAKAPLASPALTGAPTAPTAAQGTNTTQLASTAFVGLYGLGAIITETDFNTPTTFEAFYAANGATNQSAGAYNHAGLTLGGLNGNNLAQVDFRMGATTSQFASRTKSAGVWGSWIFYAEIASPTFTGVPAAPTAAAGTNTTQLATTAYAMAAAPNASYRNLMQCAGSHIAAKVAGTYAMGQGDPLAVSGTGTLYPIQIIAIAAADFPTVNGLTTKLRIRGQIAVNDVAPTGNFTFGLYPVTRPATSGGAGLCIYTLGTVVSGSNGATVSAPAADSHSNLVGADFAIPADGLYVIGVVTTATVATSSHMHFSAVLQQRNT